VDSKIFVTSFQLDGVQRTIIESPEKAFVEITKPKKDSSVGLVLVNDDISNTIGNKLAELSSKKSTPLVFELHAPESKRERWTIECR